jgi:hypothetical protein
MGILTSGYVTPRSVISPAPKPASVYTTPRSVITPAPKPASVYNTPISSIVVSTPISSVSPSVETVKAQIVEEKAIAETRQQTTNLIKIINNTPTGIERLEAYQKTPSISNVDIQTTINRAMAINEKITPSVMLQDGINFKAISSLPELTDKLVIQQKGEVSRPIPIATADEANKSSVFKYAIPIAILLVILAVQ